MINTVVLDIGNVLAEWSWDKYLRKWGYSEEIIKRIGNATVNNTLWKEIDRNVDIKDTLIDKFVANDPDIAKDILYFVEHSDEVVDEYDYATSLIKELKANGYKVFLLSNYGGRNFAYARNNFRFFKYVDGSLISYEVGYVKPEIEIYKAFIDRFDINPIESIYLDDLSANIDAAKALGFHTILFKNIEQAMDEMHRQKIKCTL